MGLGSCQFGDILCGITYDSHHSQHTIVLISNGEIQTFLTTYKGVFVPTFDDSPPNFRRTCGNAFGWKNHLKFVGGVSSLHVSPLQLRSTEAGIGGLEVGWSCPWHQILPHVPQVARSRAESLLVLESMDGWLLRSDFWGKRYRSGIFGNPRLGNSVIP